MPCCALPCWHGLCRTNLHNSQKDVFTLGRKIKVGSCSLHEGGALHWGPTMHSTAQRSTAHHNAARFQAMCRRPNKVIPHSMAQPYGVCCLVKLESTPPFLSQAPSPMMCIYHAPDLGTSWCIFMFMPYALCLAHDCLAHGLSCRTSWRVRRCCSRTWSVLVMPCRT